MSTQIADWREQSACRDADPETFFPAPSDTAGLQEALDHCAVCPVREQCLQYALDSRQEYGVWGGLAETELREEHGLTNWQRPPSSTRCGTEGGYRRHINVGDGVCGACEKAHIEWRTADRHRRLTAEHATKGGSEAGYKMHRALGEEPCTDCATASATARKRRKQQRQEGVPDTSRCGTYAGYRAHERNGTERCDPCREAKRSYRSARKPESKAPVQRVHAWQHPEIVRRYERGAKSRELAEEYGVSATRIRQIVQATRDRELTA